MKILHLGRYGSVKGGTEAYVQELCAGQRQAGHEVALAYRFDPDESRPEVRNGAQLAAFTAHGSEPAAQEGSEVARLLQAMQPDIVHIHNFEAAWLPGFVSRFVPTISGIHDHRLTCPTGTRYWAAWDRACGISPGAQCLGYNLAAHCGSLKANATLEPYLRWRSMRLAAQHGPALQVFSRYSEQALRKTGIQSPVFVTPYPAPALPSVDSSRSAPATPVVFASGRITKEKGFDLLIDALEYVTHPVRLVIAGEGHHARALRKRTTLARHSIEHLGWVSRQELANHLALSTVVAMPSAWPEPFGIAGLEAMMASRPVVATDSGGIREWLIDGVTGIAVAPRDAAAFGRALQALVSDPAACAAMGRAGRERADQCFRLDAHVGVVQDMYEEARRSWEKAA